MKKTGIRLAALLLCGALLCGAAGFGATVAADSVSDLEKKLQQLEKDAASYRGKINSSNKDIATAKALHVEVMSLSGIIDFGGKS